MLLKIVDGSDLTNPDSLVVTKNGQVMIPLKPVVTKFGFTVGWIEKEKTITVNASTMVLHFKAGSKSAITYQGAKLLANQEMAAETELINNQCYVPLSVFTEVFKARTETTDKAVQIFFKTK